MANMNVWIPILCLCVCLFYIVQGQYEDNQSMLTMDMHRQMAQIKNASEFCHLLNIDCAVLTDNSGPEDEDRMLVSGTENAVARFDACNPREQTVALPKEPDASITIWPSCTRALRCGGCCTSDVFSCEPTETRDRYVTIFKTRLPYAGAQRFQFIGAKTVQIIEHTKCDAQCKVKAIHCHPFQDYHSRTCRCICRNNDQRHSCGPDHVWDDNECTCVCPNRATTVCPHPTKFSPFVCKCTLADAVSGDIDLDLDLVLQQFNDLLSNTDVVLNPTTTAPTTSEPPTTTTTPTTTAATTHATTRRPCPVYPPCMGNWQRARLSNGRCACRPAWQVNGRA